MLTISTPGALHAENGGFRGSATAPFALSIGSPNDGALSGGVPLRERAELRLRWPEGPRWALPGLVELLERASRQVERRFPGSVLLVGDLSREGGGDLAGHASHESGRDADVGFYYTDPSGAAVQTDRLMAVRASGLVREGANLRFDDARNWALVQAVITDPKTVVQRIFVAEVVQRRLLEYAVQHAVDDGLVARARTLMKQPGSGPVHDDHFHVRVACPRNPPHHGAGVCIQSPRGGAARERTAALSPATAR
jgi:penicillin-insensitive murein endopeptidase